MSWTTVERVVQPDGSTLAVKRTSYDATLEARGLQLLEDAGAPVGISRSALESVLSSAFDALIGRGLVEEKDNLYRMKESETEIVNYYANSIIQWQKS